MLSLVRCIVYDVDAILSSVIISLWLFNNVSARPGKYVVNTIANSRRIFMALQFNILFQQAYSPTGCRLPASLMQGMHYTLDTVVHSLYVYLEMIMSRWHSPTTVSSCILWLRCTQLRHTHMHIFITLLDLFVCFSALLFRMFVALFVQLTKVLIIICLCIKSSIICCFCVWILVFEIPCRNTITLGN